MKNTNPAKKAASSAAPARKTAPATAEKAVAKKAPARRTTAKKATTSGGRTRQSAPPQALRVREDETPWTAEELAEVRASIEADVAHLREEIQVAEADLVGLMRDGGDGAGDDQADAGAMTFEREHEISVANNAREMLIQNLHALERLDDGTYGICESCGNPIGKLRLQAAPRATLCMPCKTKQERR
jgi:RNA polymerase-binding protein DksA